MSDFKNFLAEQMKNPEFKAEWDALEPELAIIQAEIDAKEKSGLSQEPDPFYSAENQARLLAAKKRMEETGGTVHGLIEVDDV